MFGISPAITLILIVTIFSALYHYRSQLKYLRNIFVFKPHAEEKEKRIGEPRGDIDPILKCPKCGKKMDKVSFLQSNLLYSFWRNNLSPFRLFSFNSELDQFSLPNRQRIPTSLYIYRCETCRITAYFE